MNISFQVETATLGHALAHLTTSVLKAHGGLPASDGPVQMTDLVGAVLMAPA